MNLDRYADIGKLLAITSLFLLASNPLLARDITSKVFENSNYDERVAAACAGRCGNRGWSRLDSVVVEHLHGAHYETTARASVRYHQHSEAPIIFGIQLEQAINIEYSIAVTAKGDLDASNCMVIVTAIDIQGDHLNLIQGTETQIGKRHHLKNCDKFLF